MFSVVMLLAIQDGAELPAWRGHCGGGWGGGCYGYSGCYGGYGGCYGGYGGCYGGYYGGCYSYAPCYSYSYCAPTYAYCAPVYYTYPSCGVIVSPAMPGAAPAKKDGDKKPDGDKKEPETASLPATIQVTLPADAKLTIDNTPTTSTSGQRVFVSPSLPMGRTFHYTLQATVVREGKPVTLQETVAVRAGEQANVTLTLPAAGTGVASR